jgi:uncharacterized protein
MAHAFDTPALETPALVPIAARERILTLDVLRGIALLFVLVSNAWEWFSGFHLIPSATREQLLVGADQAVEFAMALLVKGKAMSIFSFLFGLGFGVQMLRAEDRGVAIAPIYRRRLLVLFGIGVLHATLLWYGDILHAYALLGFLLLAFHQRGDRTLLVCAALLVLLAPSIMFNWSLLTGTSQHPAAAQQGFETVSAAILAAFQSGGYAQIVRANVSFLWAGYVEYTRFVLSWDLPIFGFFLLGFWAARRRLFEQVGAHRALFRWGAFLALPLGFALFALMGVMTKGMTPETAPVWVVLTVHALFTSSLGLSALGYIAATTLLLEKARVRKLLSAFAPAGRMALTNYLAQTVICLGIFYGGGLVGHIGPAPTVAIAFLIFPAQMLYSRWWLARYRFGPMEWLWRSVTYGQMQPMRHPVLEPEAAEVPVLTESA